MKKIIVVLIVIVIALGVRFNQTSARPLSSFPCGEIYEGIHVYCEPTNDYFYCDSWSGSEIQWEKTDRIEEFGGVDYTVSNFGCGNRATDPQFVVNFTKKLGIVVIGWQENFDAWCPGRAVMKQFGEIYEEKMIPIYRLDCVE